MTAPLPVERVLAHGTGQRPASGGQERRTTPPVEASVRPVAPRVHPVHWHVLRSMRRQRGGRAALAAAKWRLLSRVGTATCVSAAGGRRLATAALVESPRGGTVPVRRFGFSGGGCLLFGGWL